MTELYITERMRGKMKGFSSLNTNPLTNDFCIRMNKNENTICSRCYSIKGIKSWCMGADAVWQRNSDILSEDILPRNLVPFIMGKYFRFHAHGELINDYHFINLCLIAERNPKTRFALWSKRVGIVKRNAIFIPNNLVMIYSNHKINNDSKYIPEFFDKKFSVFKKDYAIEHGIKLNCAGKSCVDCLLCYEKNGVRYVNEKLK